MIGRIWPVEGRPGVPQFVALRYKERSSRIPRILMASRFVKYDLEHITDYIEFESFSHDLMSREGYKDIQPLGGFKDKGRDAVHVNEANDETTIFAYSVREDWKEKLFEDLDKIQEYGHQCDKVVYITTGEPTAQEIDALVEDVTKNYRWRLDIFGLERIGTLVESHYKDLMDRHPSIFVLSSRLPTVEPSNGNLDRTLYAQYLMRAYEEWLERYTPLLAQHREFSTLLIPSISKKRSGPELPATELPAVTPIAVVLGESGAGKTTALWRIAVERSKTLIEGKEAEIPILISLRGWSSAKRCRDLAQQAFTLVGASPKAVEREMVNGNCLILIDGLNEISQSHAGRAEAYKDIQHFLVDYSRNRFVICCRTSDYEPRLLDLEQLRPKLPEVKVFEIRRLDPRQVIDYIERYFRTKPELSGQLLDEMNVNSDKRWRDSRSLLNLVRIPLYLQLVIDEYQRSGKLPDNRGKLLRAFFHAAVEREVARQAGFVDRFAKERLLGSLAFGAIQHGESMRIPEARAHSIIRHEMSRLKSEGVLQSDLTFGSVWQEILSNNFLAAPEWGWVEWNHQLIHDYFLACEIVHIRTGRNTEDINRLNRQITKEMWEEACVIAIGLLDPANGSSLLEDLVRIDARIAQRAFESLSPEDAMRFAESIVSLVASDVDDDSERINRIAVCLPFLPVVQALGECFRVNPDPIRVGVAKAVSSLVIEHFANANVLETRSKSPFGSWRQGEIVSSGRVVKAVKRALQLLEAWIHNRNDYVRFHAAKGLWETDRGLASLTLREIRLQGDPNLATKVDELMEDWGIT